MSVVGGRRSKASEVLLRAAGVGAERRHGTLRRWSGNDTRGRRSTARRRGACPGAGGRGTTELLVLGRSSVGV